MKALIYKEFLQLIRDSSSLLLGIVLPIILILIIGYGIIPGCEERTLRRGAGRCIA